MRKLTIEEVKSLIRQCGNDPKKHSKKELQDIANKFVKLTPQEQDEWEEKHKYDD